ncbi:MAG: FliH/SctL family protein [Acidobacteriota bacterium]
MSTSDNREAERPPAPAGNRSRIFPVEEVQRLGFHLWQIENVTTPVEVAPSILVRPQDSAPAPAPAPEVDYEAKMDELRAQHRRELDEAVQRARVECEARAQSLLGNEIEPWLKRMAQSIEDIATVKQRYLAESEEQLVRLAVAVARRILYREIQVDAEALFGLIHAATSRAELRELNRILLNPKDHQALLPHLERLQLPPRVEVVADAGIERGALLLESTSGVLDASIQAQLDEVERGFIDLLGRRG